MKFQKYWSTPQPANSRCISGRRFSSNNRKCVRCLQAIHTPVVQTLDSAIHWEKSFQRQPSKKKFLLGRHLATKSFGLGRLFYKSSRQLKNFRHHGDLNSRNLEGCVDNTILVSLILIDWIVIFLVDSAIQHLNNQGQDYSQALKLFLVVCCQMERIDMDSNLQKSPEKINIMVSAP